MKRSIRTKVLTQEPGLYISILFPITVAFLLTFVGARVFSRTLPDFYILWAGIHVHHFVYGFLVVMVSGYLALVFNGPRAKYWIALLHGLGLGLAFDEFGMWINLTEDDPARLSYNGLVMVLAIVGIIISAKKGVKMASNHWPFRHDRLP
ncbi:MAG: hypothetical protein A3B99_01275 [Candidatus Yanofskybacteria bacterium RIFCSPHIGHO2_02_FULL_44_12b]|uniref:Uncharacterized protein n=1 Tax=Candidatus Yanofskybacteria bacterium RIFCSPLOWO2_01_FULL_44_22 TaxID=1802697 RepID=A0A1F8GJ75_9BACT|nr:MAG: hypothetical protein A2659_03940 [Candidatus Yanofskybacteria bacterium RIFCSPHIGHO2_01_FULL_44_24]OGN15460.1 MAG: hypothetical protein A3B99_01275 [Candidatus Yanofskybacteria bacterium RIFCSPHIGHO2_02_FULL_44_12b]OGN25444.1 MAG: hypothetical protein A2925_00245 [Candidatus Yanofskybacteria bacterium RIFCSPLOWO2_01_FULL_44_22]